MADDSVVPGKGTSKGGKSEAAQVVAALVVVGCVIGVLWGLSVFDKSTGRSGKPAACEPRRSTDSPEYPMLCAALNRPDLPTLLGTPDEYVSVAQPGGGTFTYADGTKDYDASAEVQLGSTNVRVADNGDMSVKDFADFTSSSAASTPVLGHPSLTYSDHTMAIFINGGNSSTGTGGIARHLVVAKNPKGGGGSFEIAIWRQDDVTPDDAALFRIAEKVLPTVQGWVAGPSQMPSLSSSRS
jgi:hypothetical protein